MAGEALPNPLPAWITVPDQLWGSDNVGIAVAWQLVNQGRERELVALYDSAFETPQAMATQIPYLLAPTTPHIAVALERQGRGADAARLLAVAARHVEAAKRRGRVDSDLLVSAAAIAAAQGRRETALADLEKAFEQGWPLTGGEWLPSPYFSRHPAFRSIRDHPRSRRLENMIGKLIERERRETMETMTKR